MAQRDYIVNKRSTRRRKGAKQHRRLAVGVASSKVFAGMVVILLCSFGGALYWLKSGSLTVRKASSTRYRADSTARSLPPKPQERWKYIKTLENKKVRAMEQQYTDNSPESRAATKQNQADGSRHSSQKQTESKWLLQCGVFPPAGDARALQAQLALLGIESQLVAKGDWKQLLSESYANHEDAREKLGLLQQNGINDCKIIVSSDR